MKWSTSGSGIIVFIRLSEILQGAAGPRWMFFPLLDFDSAFEPLGSSFCNRHYQIKFWNSCESLLLVLLDECFSCLTLWDTFLLCSKFTFTAKDIFFLSLLTLQILSWLSVFCSFPFIFSQLFPFFSHDTTFTNPCDSMGELITWLLPLQMSIKNNSALCKERVIKANNKYNCGD